MVNQQIKNESITDKKMILPSGTLMCVAKRN